MSSGSEGEAPSSSLRASTTEPAGERAPRWLLCEMIIVLLITFVPLVLSAFIPALYGVGVALSLLFPIVYLFAEKWARHRPWKQLGIKRHAFVTDFVANWQLLLVIVIAAGVFMYFEASRIRTFLTSLADAFPNAEIVFDPQSRFGKFIGDWGLRRMGMHGSKIKWALKDAVAIIRWDNRIVVLDQFPVFRNIPRDSCVGHFDQALNGFCR